MGSVEYLDRDALFQRVANAVERGGLDVFEYPAELAALLLTKRAAFSHEEEVRLIHVGRGVDHPSDSVLLIKIDPNALIDEITVVQDKFLRSVDRRPSYN